MDYVFVKSVKAGKGDYGSVYARVRTSKVNKKVALGFTISAMEWERYRSLQYSSSTLMTSIGIKYGQFAQVLARIKTAFESEDFKSRDARSIIESVKGSILNGAVEYVEVKPRGRRLFLDYLNSYIDDLIMGRRKKRGRSISVSTSYIKGLRILRSRIIDYEKRNNRRLGLDDITMKTRDSIVAMWSKDGLLPNSINSYMTDLRTVMRGAYEDKLTKCDDFRNSNFVPMKEEVENIFLTPKQIQAMLDLDLSSKKAVMDRINSLDITEEEKNRELSKCRMTHITTLERARDIFVAGCLTGQRVSDYSRLSTDMIRNINGIDFFMLTQQKTDKKVYVPVDMRVRAILEKYGGKLPKIHPNDLNRLIKTLGLLLGWTWDCGLDPKHLDPKRGRRFCDQILSHTARRSFATNAHVAGVPLSSIMAITGHSGEKQLRRYLKLQAEDKAILAYRDFEGLIKM